MKKHIIVCTPVYDGTVHHGFMLSYLELVNKCKERGIHVDIIFTVRDSLITRSRNFLCRDFLQQHTATHMLFIDSDIQYSVDDVLQMLDADVPLIGGVYPKKHIAWDKHMGPLMNYVVVPLPNLEYIPDINSPHEVAYVGTGLMLIQRHVLEQMMEAFPKDRYMIDDIEYTQFFNCEIVDNQYLSEDYYFCHRWRLLGGKVYAAYWTRTTHWGLHGFEGNVVDFAKKLSATS